MWGNISYRQLVKLLITLSATFGLVQFEGVNTGSFTPAESILDFDNRVRTLSNDERDHSYDEQN